MTTQIKGNCYPREDFVNYLKSQISVSEDIKQSAEGTWEINPLSEEIAEPDMTRPIYKELLFNLYIGNDPFTELTHGEYFLLVPYKDTWILSDYVSREAYKEKYEHIYKLVDVTPEVESDLLRGFPITIDTFSNFLEDEPEMPYGTQGLEPLEENEEQVEEFEESEEFSPDEEEIETNEQRSVSPQRQRFHRLRYEPARPSRQMSPRRERPRRSSF